MLNLNRNLSATAIFVICRSTVLGIEVVTIVQLT